jgi:hypothetical protein
MKSKIFNKEDMPVKAYLALYEAEDGSVSLVMVDEDGFRIHRGNLLTIEADGTAHTNVKCNRNAAASLDIQLDSDDEMDITNDPNADSDSEEEDW